MVKEDINFTLTSYTEPSLSAVNYALSLHSPTLGDGDNFELSAYTEPSLSAVNFILSLIGSAVEYFGILKRWTGAIWTKAKLKFYNGSSFVEKPLKYWDGSEWKLADTTGT
jgi:hypothetical protein